VNSKRHAQGRRVVLAMKKARQCYVMTQALALAIEAIDRLPEKWQQKSDRDDMIRLLNALWPGDDSWRVAARNRLALRATPCLKVEAAA
jgi:hypothetical protein